MESENTVSPEENPIRGFLRGLIPIERLTVSQWADRERYLSSLASAEPGRWNTDRTPYLREIMDNLSALSPVRRVVVMKGAQLGFTEAGLNWFGYIVCNAPGPMMTILPTEKVLKSASESRFKPMIESTPALRELILEASGKDTQTIEKKSFPGGIAFFYGANSPSNLASQPIQYLFLDEVDRYPQNVGGEGSPIALAEARTRTFANKKIYIVSTPVTAGESVIEEEYEGTDKREYHVPCPECGVPQTLRFDQLRYDVNKAGKVTRAVYECEHCRAQIEESNKPVMLGAGFWQATAPEHATPEIAGYYINSLYSPLGWFSWKECAQAYEDGKKSELKMQTFVNTILGKGYASKGEVPSWERLYKRRETYPLNRPPKDVVFLTAGVDVQKDRLEVEVVGWCRGRRSYSIDYRVFVGDTGWEATTWKNLSDLLNEVWEREDGMQLGIAMMAIDTGFNSHAVYNFVRNNDPSRCIAIKGLAQQPIAVAAPKPIDVKRDGTPVGKVMLWKLGVSVLKAELYGWLKIERDLENNPPDCYCHFPQYAPEYFQGLTAEQLETSIRKGYAKYEWVKKYARNEPLDMRIYARAAASILGMDRFTEAHWAAREAQSLRRPVPNQKRKRPTPEKSDLNIWD